LPEGAKAFQAYALIIKRGLSLFVLLFVQISWKQGLYGVVRNFISINVINPTLNCQKTK